MTSSTDRKPLSKGEFYGFLILAVVVALLVIQSKNQPTVDIVPKGTPLPPLWAEGWLNNDEPVTSERLADKVVVVDCWATYCIPCRKAMPELAELYAKYHPLGVEFLGITTQTSRDLPAIENFVNKIEGFDWPVGYGTLPMQDMLGIRLIPTVIVFAPGSGVVWSGAELYGIEDAIDQALAKER